MRGAWAEVGGSVLAGGTALAGQAERGPGVEPRRPGRPPVDLSTCVNPYGPAPAALEALGDLRPRDLALLPYDGAARIERAYARLLGVPADELVAGRGTSEFVWALARGVAHADVAVPLPACADHLRAFPGRGVGGGAAGQVPTADGVDAAAAGARVVLLSNPHNPTGVTIPPAELAEIARRRPGCTLVVDESLVDFLPDPAAATLVGTDRPNVVVLRAPSSFYGIAATRIGVAWCRNPARIRALTGRQEPCPVSGLDARVGAAALGDAAWAAGSRLRLGRDARWLTDALRRAGLPPVTDRVDVPVRCVLSRHAEALAAAFARQGVGVRVLGSAYGVVPGGVRILAPHRDRREAVLAALAALSEAAGAAGADGG